MSENKKRNALLLIASIVLFLALFDGWQYGFFTLLRFVVCGATAYMAWKLYKEDRSGWSWFFGFIAILFNPIIPIHLSRDVWIFIDAITGILLLGSMIILRSQNRKTTLSV